MIKIIIIINIDYYFNTSNLIILLRIVSLIIHISLSQFIAFDLSFSYNSNNLLILCVVKLRAFIYFEEISCV